MLEEELDVGECPRASGARVNVQNGRLPRVSRTAALTSSIDGRTQVGSDADAS